MKIYLIKSCTGEYEDYSERILGYVQDEGKAKDLQELLTEQYKDCLDMGYESDGELYPNYFNKDYTKDKLYKVYVDYTGVGFQVECIEEIKDETNL